MRSSLRMCFLSSPPSQRPSRFPPTATPHLIKSIGDLVGLATRVDPADNAGLGQTDRHVNRGEPP